MLIIVFLILIIILTKDVKQTGEIGIVDTEKLKICEDKTERAFSICLDSLAVSEKNLAYCEEIQIEGESQYIKSSGGLLDRYQCYWNVIFAIGDGSICENLSNKIVLERPYRDDCYSRLAIKLQKPEYCDNIKSGASSSGARVLDECISKTASSQEDCEKVVRVNERNRCYIRIAILNQEISSCLKIEQPPGSKSSTLINGITVEFNPQFEGCIGSLARSLSNQEICEQAVKKDECIEAVQRESSEPNF